MKSPINIAGRAVGPGLAPFIIAEAGVNHDGHRERALALVDAAAAAGAHAVKFQTFRAEEVVTASAPKAAYQEANTGEAGSQLAMLKALELSPDDHLALRDRCRQRDIVFLSTPFDVHSVDLLESLDIPAYKIASGEVTNLPFLEYVAGKGRPVILSTGMSHLEEVAQAVETLEKAGCKELALLHCLSSYPADPAQVNLRAMAALELRPGLPVGYSDHTLGVEVALAAVALGASVIEKHFTLDRGLPGPDHAASATTDELSALVAGASKVHAALGSGAKLPAASELETARVARRSLVAALDIAAGEALSRDKIAIKRPAGGLAPARLEWALGRKARQDIPAGSLITAEMLL